MQFLPRLQSKTSRVNTRLFRLRQANWHGPFDYPNLQVDQP
jgi:hypothetical protein